MQLNHLHDTQIKTLREVIREEIDFTEHISDQDFSALIDEKMAIIASEMRWTARERLLVKQKLIDYFRGFDIIDPLLRDRSITEIMVNGPNDIFFEKGGQITRYPYVFESKERLEDLIQLIVSKVNRSINDSNPIVDARLPDGSRVHAVLPPIALNGPSLTIRKFPDRPYSMDDLISKGSISNAAAIFLQYAITAKYNLFISGGTGSGKTTMLNALSQYIPFDERVVTIEDAAELKIYNVPNLVSLETRVANTEGKGEITIRHLIRAALRMRPNRIIVGEVRGVEAIDMLQAMNTGHDGSLSTGHANSVKDMLSRLEMMTSLETQLPLAVIREQIVAAIQIAVHVSRNQNYHRHVTEITEIVGLQNGEYVLNQLFGWNFDPTEKEGNGTLLPTGNQLIRDCKWIETKLGKKDLIPTIK
jgi:pilus assembly protein CpaF